ncbi:FYN-binding protein isoform X1 [Silurus asotus]|uniref:FYN-binding protein isoform X1 n=1 Tax=Silurus asotus TaxID=30991 RepID=A0AAD5AEN4_SILAS|nr:FYN-binding protein isoform X1 [Silurus asotus]
MGDNVDVKALRAKFHAQADRPISSGGAYARPHIAGQFPAPLDNGLPRLKPAPKPVLPGNPSTESPKRFNPVPQGVFPKPPPSHRIPKEDPVVPVNDFENAARVKMTGELLQNRMLQHLEKKPQSFSRSILPSQRSMSEVIPLRKPLPNAGQRPTKPKRPPNVGLDRFCAKGPVIQSTVPLDTKTLEGPPRPPKSTFMSASQPITQRSIEPEQDTYDDIDLPPPPPPPPKPSSSESWTSSFSSQADEDSDTSEIYEHIEEQEEITQRRDFSGKKKQKDHKRQQELEKREQKERLKKENEYRKKFKYEGPIKVLVCMMVDPNANIKKASGKDLSVVRGEILEVIQETNEKKVLCRNEQGKLTDVYDNDASGPALLRS